VSIYNVKSAQTLEKIDWKIEAEKIAKNIEAEIKHLFCKTKINNLILQIYK